MFFEEPVYTVSEGDSVVELTVVATGAMIDFPFKVVVSTYDSDPVSAAGESTSVHECTPVCQYS